MSVLSPNIFTGKDSLQNLQQFFFRSSFSQVFVLADENTRKHCYPKVKKLLPKHHVISIKSGEQSKTLATCELIWKRLTEENADRKSLLINLGGGVISDLGGFAAGCYKRGIKFINLPTTLLAMVDASVGSKTGVDFKNFKNQIGLFNDPEAVFIHTCFLKTLPERELRAGMAEVIKHYLIADKEAFNQLWNFLIDDKSVETDIRKLDWDELVQKNISIKAAIVARDKFEIGERKVLNFAHTIGHALETYFLSREVDVLHGEAVAAGIVCEGFISVHVKKLPGASMAKLTAAIGGFVPNLPRLRKHSIPAVLKLIKQDKKSDSGKNKFTLLKGIGNSTISNTVDESMIADALRYYCEGFL